MGWYWDGTRHKSLECYVLKNGTKKVGCIYTIRGGWTFSYRSGPPNTKKEYGEDCLHRVFETRAEAEQILYNRHMLKRDQVAFSSDVKMVKLSELMKHKENE